MMKPMHEKHRQLPRDEERFPLRIAVRTPPGGFGDRYATMMDWLDENCGLNHWLIMPAGTRGVCNDAIAVYVTNPTSALAFMGRWCMPGDPPGLYEFRRDGKSDAAFMGAVG